MVIIDIKTNAKLRNLIFPPLHHELQNCIEESWAERASLFDTTFDCKVGAGIVVITSVQHQADQSKSHVVHQSNTVASLEIQVHSKA